MRTLIQRVLKASVTINNNKKAEIGQGLLILVSIGNEDTEEDVEWLTHKIANLRIFDDEDGVMNKSVIEVKGEILIVSQFTLMASYKKGNRPSWINAAKHNLSIPLYQEFCRQMTEAIGQKVQTGEFGADMKVALINDGPVTIFMDTKNKE